jgi:hypothetical protein
VGRISRRSSWAANNTCNAVGERIVLGKLNHLWGMRQMTSRDLGLPLNGNTPKYSA